MQIQLFIAYAQEDANYCQQLRTHLAALERMEHVQIWFDGEIIAGQDWESELQEHLETADIILLLVSPDFIASDFCYETIFPIAIKLHKSQKAIVIPVIIRQCIWDTTPLAKMHALPKNGVPPGNPGVWTSPDEAYAHIAHELNLIVNAELGKRGFPVETVTTPLYPQRKFKQGKVLYLIPEQMEVEKKHPCYIRIAPEDIDIDILKERLKNVDNAVIENLRIDSIMKAEIIDDTDGEAFDVDRIGELEQPIEEDNYTEWRYNITPKKEGTFTLLIKISVLIKVAELNKLVYKDVVVLDRTIQVSTYTIEQAQTQWQLANQIVPFTPPALKDEIEILKNEEEYITPPDNKRLFARIVAALVIGVFFLPALAWAFNPGWLMPLYLKLAYDDHRPLQEERIAVKKDGKWGFVNRWGIESTKPQYDELGKFEGGIAMASIKNRKVGIVKQSGQSGLERMWWPKDEVIDCGEHGNCNPMTKLCDCLDGYTGERCQTPPLTPGTANPCANTNCGTHGKCNPQTGKCDCKDGYTGEYCQTPPAPNNPCAKLNCGAHGTCNPNTGKCDCKDGYTGSKCQTPPVLENPCAGINCGAHGNCNPNTGKCDCKDGYTGDKCQISPQEAICNGLRCSENGTCDPIKKVCNCKPGYEGKRCQTKSDPCKEVRCPVNRICVNGKCQCRDGYTGDKCDILIDKCANVNCEGNRICNPKTGKCICKEGFTGVNCDEEIPK